MTQGCHKIQYNISFSYLFKYVRKYIYKYVYKENGASQVALVVKKLPANAGDLRDMGSIPGLGRSPGEGMATHSSILVWRIPWTEEPGGPQSQRLGRG